MGDATLGTLANRNQLTRKDRMQIRRKLRSLLADVDNVLFGIRNDDAATYGSILDLLDDIKTLVESLDALVVELAFDEQQKRARQDR